MGDTGTAIIGAATTATGIAEMFGGAGLSFSGNYVLGGAISYSGARKVGIGSTIYYRSKASATDDLNRLFASNDTPAKFRQAKGGAGNAAEFENSICKLPVGERVATVKTKAAEVAEQWLGKKFKT